MFFYLVLVLVLVLCPGAPLLLSSSCCLDLRQRSSTAPALPTCTVTTPLCDRGARRAGRGRSSWASSTSGIIRTRPGPPTSSRSLDPPHQSGGARLSSRNFRCGNHSLEIVLRVPHPRPLPHAIAPVIREDVGFLLCVCVLVFQKER